jgi:hypothetical protein
LKVHGVNDVTLTEPHTAEPLLPDPSAFEVDIAIENYKDTNNQIPTEFMKAEGRTMRFDIHKLIYSIWNKEELPEEWKESIIVPIYKKGDTTNCSKYRDTSLMSTMYKILSNIPLSGLTPHAEEIIAYYQCGLRRKRFITDHIFYIRQILLKNGYAMKQCISYLD